MHDSTNTTSLFAGSLTTAATLIGLATVRSPGDTGGSEVSFAYEKIKVMYNP